MSQSVRPQITPPFGGQVATVEEAYAACRRVTRDAARNFYFAFVTLPQQKRDAIYAAYAFCRLSDDIADDVELEVDRSEALAKLSSALDDAYDGSPDGAVFTALQDAAERYSIPKSHFEDVITGVTRDLTDNRYETFEELREYCYYVASVVGLICIEIFEYTSPEAVQHAIDLGIAMQLTNIIRDVGEDARNGRIYLPLEDLRRFGYTEGQLLREESNDNFRKLMAFQAERARSHYVRGRMLFPLLDRRSRACPQTLSSVYSKILDRLEKGNFPVFEKRVGLSKVAKLSLMARLWLKSVVPGPW